MFKTLLMLGAVAAGSLIPYQGTVNSQLGKTLDQPFLAALVSFTGGMLTLAIIVLVLNLGLPAWTPKKPVPWYLFTGGLPGVVFVTTTLVLMPRIGVVATVGLMLVGQLIGSIVFDHFGVLGTEVRPANVRKMVGVALLGVGAFIIIQDRGTAQTGDLPNAPSSDVDAGPTATEDAAPTET